MSSAAEISNVHKTTPLRCRTIWISDVHLGFKGCSAQYLLDFLRSVECERIYLVGDIIDFWAMKRRPFWPQAHNDVIRILLGMAKHGTEVILVPGNHDEVLRDYEGMTFGNVSVVDRAFHTRADGRRMMVIHGDQFDGVVRCSRLLAILGSWAYGWLLEANRAVNFARRKFGWPYWSLAGSVKSKVKNAVRYITSFEQAVAREVRKLGLDGVVCGHIHQAEIRDVEGILYCNCGDWVESCTALVEHKDGSLELLRWLDTISSEKRYQEAA